MKHKKVLSGLLIAGLILSNGITAFAAPEQVVEKAVQVENSNVVKDPQISEEKARDLVKKYIKEFFKIDIDEDQFQLNIQNRDNMGWNSGNSVWYLSLYQYNKDTNLSFDVTINGDSGELISINKWEYSRTGENQVSKFTKEEAQKIAEDFLQKRHGNLLEKVKLDEKYIGNYYSSGDGLRPTVYNFNFARYEDGIPVLSDGVNIGVNSGTGEVISYSFTWRDEKLPEGDNVISKEKAREILENDFDTELSYIAVRDINNPYYDEIKEVKLAYTQKYENGPLIDAKTGEFIDYSGTSGEVKKKDITKEEKLEIDKLAAKHNAGQKINTKEEANKIAEKILSEVYDEDVKILGVSYASNMIRNGKEHKSWEIRFGFEDSSMSEGYVSLDAATGSVLNLNYHNWRLRDSLERGEKEVEPKLTWEQAYDKAIKILKKLNPDKLKSTETEQIYREFYYYYNDTRVKDIEYHFNFPRKENGVIFSNNYISITFDTTTGRVQSIYINWEDLEFPKVENIMDKEKAKNVFLEQLDTRLAYSYIYPNGIGNEVKPDIKLVYSNEFKGDLAYYNLLDAKTGVFMDWNGQEQKSAESKKDAIEGIKDHWAYKELKIMAERNIIDLDTISLEDKVTKKQVLKMMTIAKGNIYYGGNELAELKFTDVDKKDPDYRYLQLAVQYGLVDNAAKPLNGDKYINREELAELLIKAVELDKVANIQGIYNIPVSDKEDISKERFGHVALSYGLGIIKGRDGAYLPKEEVDLTQVAIAIYRVMETMGNYFR